MQVGGLLDPGGSETTNTKPGKSEGPRIRVGFRGPERPVCPGCLSRPPSPGGGEWLQMLTFSWPRLGPRGRCLRPLRGPAPAVPSAFAVPPAGTVALPAAAPSAGRVKSREAVRPLGVPALALPGSPNSSSLPSPTSHLPSPSAPQTTLTANGPVLEMNLMSAWWGGVGWVGVRWMV